MIINGNALHLPLADNSVQLVVTSPPYWMQRDYGHPEQLGREQDFQDYIAKLVEVFREVRRVMRKDALLFLNLGDMYASSGKGVGGKTSKQLTNPGSFTSLPTTHTINHGIKNKSLYMMPARVAIALLDDGWILRNKIIWWIPNKFCQSAGDRLTNAYEEVFILSQQGQYSWNHDAARVPKSQISIRREMRRVGHVKWEHGVPGQNAQGATQPRDRREEHEIDHTANMRDIWKIANTGFKGKHSATFPEELVRRAIKLGSKPGDVVIDPFSGSGTVPRVATKLTRVGLGIELALHYAIESLPKLEVQQELPLI